MPNKPRYGIIALAFGLHKDEAGPSNEAIFEVASNIKQQLPGALLASQWEVNLAANDGDVDFVVSSQATREYITTKEAIDRCLEEFMAAGVTRVVIVAHPLHLQIIRTFVDLGWWSLGGMEMDEQFNKLMRSVPYDRDPGNLQPWTRGPIRFVTYLMKVLVTKRHGLATQ
ncbi:hypothetical protein CL689_05905 [Candidatus Saccharibacteria bacterium]|nr:hypothetical protein [Candidatus Saccharibacteria bacterium]MBJ58443.1 hypothetical protein [Candidatus Saccharibacteria bacterium]MBQ69574.1 hypothetical protein [Candidatus Saccharibacteria bacterium]